MELFYNQVLFEYLYINKHFKNIHTIKNYQIFWICEGLLCLLFSLTYVINFCSE
jgi:hypothetical protein